MTVFPQHMRARERRVAAEIDFDGRREPAEIVAIALRNQEGSLGEIHLARDAEHPGGFGWSRKNANCCWIAGEWSVGECVHLSNAEAHASKSIAIGLNGRVVVA